MELIGAPLDTLRAERRSVPTFLKYRDSGLAHKTGASAYAGNSR
jgi:hypothetical protein